MWTRFMDMHSGGGAKEKCGYSGKYVTLVTYKKMVKDTVLFITKKDIKKDERIGEVPEQGYFGQD